MAARLLLAAVLLLHSVASIRSQQVCGKEANGKTCATRTSGPCCSHDGFCGATSEFCGPRCQSGCPEAHPPPSRMHLLLATRHPPPPVRKHSPPPRRHPPPPVRQHSPPARMHPPPPARRRPPPPSQQRHPPPHGKPPPPPQRKAPPPPKGEVRTTGLVPPLTSTPPPHFNPYFRYASVGYTGTVDQPKWETYPSVNWAVEGVVQPVVKDQGPCNGCWAFAAVAVIEATFAIMHGGGPVNGSEQQILDCQGSDSCNGGWPGDALEYVANNTANRYGGLCTEEAIPYKATDGSCDASLADKGRFGVVMWEKIDFYGSLGFLLALQFQPLIVSLEVDYQTFLDYKGGVYNDPQCFHNALVNHAVALVGYVLDAEPPHWIIRNSWGPSWGEGGYMRIAIVGGNGICGISSSPAYYPVIAGSSPCSRAINPCGKFSCKAKGRSNTCDCQQPFVAVTNVDGSQSCAPVEVCTAFLFNPCGPGICNQNGRGGYTCICQQGFESGFRVDGSPTCVPRADLAPTTYRVQAGDTCELIWTAFSLTEAAFLVQNKGLTCLNALRAGTSVNVNLPADALVCSLFYLVQRGDTCVSIIIRIYQGNLKAFQEANPGVACRSGSLYVGQQLCLRREAQRVGALPQCTKYYDVQAGDTCQSIEQKCKLAALELYQLNPGINCNNLVPEQGRLGQQVCVSAAPLGGVGSCERGRVYQVRRGSTCASLVYHLFRRSDALFRFYNRYVECRSSFLYVGLPLCVP